jgi:hypothetical protein
MLITDHFNASGKRHKNSTVFILTAFFFCLFRVAEHFSILKPKKK